LKRPPNCKEQILLQEKLKYLGRGITLDLSSRFEVVLLVIQSSLNNALEVSIITVALISISGCLSVS